MSNLLFSLKDVSFGYTNINILENIEFNIHKNDRITIIGNNGTGKTTLIKLIEGKIDVSSGQKFVLPTLTISKLNQEFDEKEDISVIDFILTDESCDKYEALSLLNELRIDPNLSMLGFSGGELRKAALVKAFSRKADVLLLDEPTNHLDIETINWLETKVHKYHGAVICISHDKKFLDNTCRAIAWLENKKLRFAKKKFSEFNDWQEEVYTQIERENRKLDVQLKQEERYLLRGVTARRKRNTRRLEKLASLRDRKNKTKNANNYAVQKITADASSKIIFHADTLNKKFGEKNIVSDFNLKVISGDKLGIVGPNGCGKSTLVKILIGEQEQDSGKLYRAKNLDIAYFDQHYAQIDTSKLAWQTINDGSEYIEINGNSTSVIGYLKRFLFSVEEIQSSVSTFSGGQKNRLLLAKIFSQKSNILILDEPTNDLDLQTVELLEDLLIEYDGTLIVISHDRDFITNTTASFVVFSHDNPPKEVIGNYNEYLDKNPPIDLTEKRKEKKEIKKEKKKVEEDQSKLSFKETQLLEKIPEQLQKIDDTISSLNNTINEKELYTEDFEKFMEITAKIEDLDNLKEDLEIKWMEIVEKEENIEKNKS